MKTILITGLDGSGKSTLLARLQEQQSTASFEILFAPQIVTEGLAGDPSLMAAALFVNALGAEADRLELPQFKAIALFASMLLFPKLLLAKQEKNPKTIFCERHPLIDTGVYARFYAGKLGPNSIDPKILQDLDRRFPHELQYLLGLLPIQYRPSDRSGLAAHLMDFIYQWFFMKKKYAPADLQLLFGLPLPDFIYFLKASPQTLYGRIRHRAIKEAHESPEVFKKLDGAYEALFAALEKDLPLRRVDANDLRQLDLLFEEIFQQQSA
ncbi:MAG TPA: hypothetical protein ENJ95_24510 [Bacteroidetes bacterium]|nr:hypothetical protein [Bacteroidota bacterium]